MTMVTVFVLVYAAKGPFVLCKIYNIIFWTWEWPPVWTMLKKTALFLHGGFPNWGYSCKTGHFSSIVLITFTYLTMLILWLWLNAVAGWQKLCGSTGTSHFFRIWIYLHFVLATGNSSCNVFIFAHVPHCTQFWLWFCSNSTFFGTPCVWLYIINACCLNRTSNNHVLITCRSNWHWFTGGVIGARGAATSATSAGGFATGEPFSCPGQLNRWPYYSVSEWVRHGKTNKKTRTRTRTLGAI